MKTLIQIAAVSLGAALFSPVVSAEQALRVMVVFSKAAADNVDASATARKIVSEFQSLFTRLAPEMDVRIKLAGDQAYVVDIESYRSRGGPVCALTHSADRLLQEGDRIGITNDHRSFLAMRSEIAADISLLITNSPSKPAVNGVVDVDYGMASEQIPNSHQLTQASVGLTDVIENDGANKALLGLVKKAPQAKQYFRDRRMTFRSVLSSLNEATADADYDRMIKQAKAAPNSIDYLQLRALYTQTSKHSPLRHMATGYKDTLLAAGKAINKDKDYPAALKHCSAIIEKHFLDIEGHYWCMRAYEGLKQKEKARYHQSVTSGLLSSLYADGDGYCPEYPITVIDLSEEFAIMYLSGDRRGGHKAIEVGGVNFDVYEATSFEHRTKRKYYFDTTILRQGYRKR